MVSTEHYSNLLPHLLLKSTNTGPSKRLEIGEAINNILENKPYKQPKISIAKKLYAIIREQGIDEGISFIIQPSNGVKTFTIFPSLNSMASDINCCMITTKLKKQ